MCAMTIRVINNSNHDFQCIGSWGDSISCNSGALIPGGEKGKRIVEIGTIDLPKAGLRSGNWGWWYVQDVVNKATIEFFAFADPWSHNGDRVSAGLRANNSHNIDRVTPNPLPGYFDTAKDNDSFTLIIQSQWTDNPPDYIFNFGHYGCKYAPVLDKWQWAAHAYVKVVSFDGSRTVNFDCYGGTYPDDPSNDWVYPSLSFTATEDQLLLARAICSFEIDESRTDYGRKPYVSTLTPSGKLRLGDCCGIIYLHSGVCHQMVNRICAAVTNLDAGDMADMALYNDTKGLWGTYGKLNNPGPGVVWDRIFNAYSDQMTLTDKQLKALGVCPDAKDEAVRLLYGSWEDYLRECRNLVAQYKNKKKP